MRPFLASFLRPAVAASCLAAAAHWILAAHRPASVPEVMAAAAVPVLAHSPVALAIDALNAVAVAQDVAFGSWLILVVLAGVAASWATRLGLGPVLAVAVGVGVTFHRGPWSGHAAGADAFVLLAAVVLVRAFSQARHAPPARWSIALAAAMALALIAHQPMAVWLILPLALAAPGLPPRVRGWLAAVSIVAASVAILVCVRSAMTEASCLSDSGLGAWLQDAVLPSHTFALSRVSDELQLFGMVAAAWAMWLSGGSESDLRTVTLTTGLAALAANALGALSVAAVVAVATACWLPWFAQACHRLWHHSKGGGRIAGRTAIALVACGLPIVRHVVYVPAPVTTGTPSVWVHTFSHMGGTLVASADLAVARQARFAGATLVPADAAWIRRCISPSQEIVAIGTAIDALREQGAALEDTPIVVPLAVVAKDVRPTAVVALGITSEALRWLRPADMSAMERLGADAVGLRRRGAHASVGVAGASSTRREEPPIARSASITVDEVADRVLWHAVTVRVEPLRVDIDAGTNAMTPLVRSDTAALAIFDRAEVPMVRATATAAAGLPVALYSAISSLRLADVLDVDATSGDVQGGDDVAGHTGALLPGPLQTMIDAESSRTVDVAAAAGWHDAEPAGLLSFRWSRSQEATASFQLQQPVDLVVTVDASPAATAATPNSLRVFLNETVVAESVDGARTVEVPMALTRRGPNVLRFATATTIAAGSVPGEPRTLAAVVRHVRVVRR